MANRRRAALVAGGLATALLFGVAVGGAGAPVAQGQAPAAAPPVAPGRYQISAYAEGVSRHGAYILDTQTGQVFHVAGTGVPTALGELPFKGQRK